MIARRADQRVVGIDNLAILNGDDADGAGAVPSVGGCFKIDGSKIHEVNIIDSLGQKLSQVVKYCVNQQVRGMNVSVSYAA